MNAIDRLLSNYARQVSLPWSTQIAGKQRVWFAVYPPAEERRIRARMPQFETMTLEARHGWILVDLTRILPEWLRDHEYREGIFNEPTDLSNHQDLEAVAAEMVIAACNRDEADPSCVIVIVGLATLFDFIRVSSLIDRVEDRIRGRLLVFFPGEYLLNTYRFMDARDGFNYMAVPITSTETFMSP